MTTLTTSMPTIAQPSLAEAGGRVGSLPRFSGAAVASTHNAIDDAVADNRRRTPPEVAEQRERPRLSIAELNELDFDTVRERIASGHRDNRPAWIKALDIIDLPRNTLMNLVAPGIAAKKKLEGEVGAAGQGKVFFSDILREAGVRNNIAAGLLGFVGDVAFDPLTYLGPAGWGSKVTSTGGRSVQIGARGTRALKRGIESAATGNKIADPVVDRLIRSVVDDDVLKLAAKERKAELSRRVFGDVKAGLSGRVGRALRVIGADTDTVGGVVARRFDDVTREATGPVAEQIDAVSEFIKTYGKASAPGVRLGKTHGSTIAHIPFTEFGVHVPAFSQSGRAAETALKIANAGKTGVLSAKTPRLTEIDMLAKGIEQVRQQETKASEVYQVQRATLAKQRDAYKKAGNAELERLFTSRVELLDNQRQIAREKALADTEWASGQIRGLTRQIEQTPINESVAELLALRKYMDEAAANAAVIAKDLDDAPRLNLWAKLRGELTANDKTVFDNMRRLASEHAKSARFYGDPPSGPLMPQDELGRVLLTSDTAKQHSVSQAIQGHLDKIEDLEQEIARMDKGERRADRIFEGIAEHQDMYEAAVKSDREDIAQAAQQIREAREEIAKLTRPLWDGELHTLADARRVTRESELARMGEAKAAIAEMSKLEIDEAEALAQHTEASAAALLRLSEATGGSVAQFANSTDKAMAEIAKGVLGINSETVGYSAFAGPLRAWKWAIRDDDGVAVQALNAIGFNPRIRGRVTNALEHVDEYGRALFNVRNGTVHEAVRHMAHLTQTQYREAVANRVAEQTIRLAGIMAKHGVDESKKDDMWGLLYMMAYEHANKIGDAELGGAVFPTMVGGKTAKWVEKLDEARRSGLLADKPELVADLRAMAAESIDDLRKIGELEAAAGVLGEAKLVYVPASALPRTQRVIRGQLKQNVAGAGTKGPRGRVIEALAGEQAQRLEGFQHHKTTAFHQFEAADGTVKEFIEADRAIANMTKDAEVMEWLRQMEPELAQRAEDLRAVIDEYDALPVKPRAMDLDPWTLNEMVDKGRFAMLTGRDSGVRAAGFFDTNFATVMARRQAQHERAMASRTLGEWLNQGGIRVSAVEINGNRNAVGNKIRMANGAEAEILTRIGENNGPARIRIAGEIYKQLDKDLLNSPNNPLREMLNLDDADTMLYHELVADKLNQFGRVFDDREVQAWLKPLDFLTTQWKTMTLFHPSWLVFNIVGDGINAMMGGARPEHYTKHGRDVMQILHHANDPEWLAQAGRGVTVNGQFIPAQQLITDLRDSGVIDMSIFLETKLQQIEDVGYIPASVNRRRPLSERIAHPIRSSRQGLANWKTDAKEKLVRSLNAQGLEESSADWLQKSMSNLKVANDRYMDTMGMWFRLNQMVADNMRTLAYLSHREQGLDHAAAIQKTIRSQFDYTDMTRVERKVFRRLIPFYSWVRNNGAFQVKMLLERPGYTAAVPKLKEAIEQAVAGDSQVPEHMRPRWMRQALALQLGQDPNGRFALLAASGLPQEQAIMALAGLMSPVIGLEAVQETLNYGASSLNPIIRSPLEIGAGHEFFSGRQIGVDPTKGDITIGDVLKSQIRPLREIPRVVKEFQNGNVAQAVGRFVMGGRVQPFDAERLDFSMRREFREEEGRIRSAIRRAEYDGDIDTSMESRVQLMLMYTAMMQGGLEDAVPRWARDQLQYIASGEALNAGG